MAVQYKWLLYSLQEYYLIEKEGEGGSVQSYIVKFLYKSDEHLRSKLCFVSWYITVDIFFQSSLMINAYYKWIHSLRRKKKYKKNTRKNSDQEEKKKVWTFFQVQDIAFVFLAYLWSANIIATVRSMADKIQHQIQEENFIYVYAHTVKDFCNMLERNLLQEKEDCLYRKKDIWSFIKGAFQKELGNSVPPSLPSPFLPPPSSPPAPLWPFSMFLAVNF